MCYSCQEAFELQIAMAVGDVTSEMLAEFAVQVSDQGLVGSC